MNKKELPRTRLKVEDDDYELEQEEKEEIKSLR